MVLGLLKTISSTMKLSFYLFLAIASLINLLRRRTITADDVPAIYFRSLNHRPADDVPAGLPSYDNPKKKNWPADVVPAGHPHSLNHRPAGAPPNRPPR